eukprot:197466-Rhodomonas_salina.1
MPLIGAIRCDAGRNAHRGSESYTREEASRAGTHPEERQEGREQDERADSEEEKDRCQCMTAALRQARAAN